MCAPDVLLISPRSYTNLIDKLVCCFDRTSGLKPSSADFSSPSSLDSPRNTTVSVSRGGELQDTLPVTLTCSSDANPPVHTYVWYQGAACHPSADKSFHAARQSLAAPSGSSRTLSVTNITAEKYGQHCCVAGNSHGWQTSGVTLGKSRGYVNEERLILTPGGGSQTFRFIVIQS